MITKIINPWKSILIIDGNLVQFTIVYTHPKGTIIFSYKKIEVPQCETLGRMKPLSNRSLKCSLNSFNSVGDILYGRRDRMSISKKIYTEVYLYLMRDSSFGKTSGNSFTTGTG